MINFLVALIVKCKVKFIIYFKLHADSPPIEVEIRNFKKVGEF